MASRLLGRTPVPDKQDRAGRGRFGERQAEKALRKKGYKIVTRNWRKGQDEIDLVCREGEFLVFVEVRSRAEDALVSGIDTLTQRKKRALRRVCRAYLVAFRERPSHIRFDVVEVSLCNDGNFQLHHYENIPLFNL